MSCEHKRIKSVNGVISCIDCGEILPFEFIKKPAEKAVEKKPTRKKVK